MPISERARVADGTDRLTAALKALKQDFSTRMGSGLVMVVCDMESAPVCEPFVIPAEDMEQIKPAIIDSLRRYLSRRADLRRAEVAEIEEFI